MTKDTQAKPSAGALRAAECIELYKFTGIDAASIIDRETGNPERDKLAQELADSVVNASCYASWHETEDNSYKSFIFAEPEWEDILRMGRKLLALYGREC